MTHLTRGRWDLDYDQVAGGLVLSNVRHDAYHLASDIRATRIWVDTEPPATTSGRHRKSYVLGAPDLPMSAPARVLDPVPGATTNPVQALSGYMNLFGIQADYATTTNYLDGTPNAAALEVIQRPLFSTYGKIPPHEPGAVLDATRLSPLLKFALPPVRDRTQPYPRYLRVDYRLDIDLDNVDETALRAGGLAGSGVDNKAGVFRDSETLPSVILMPLWIIGSILLSGPNVDQLFDALEKPARHELASWGMTAGPAPPSWLSSTSPWDNVHIWPAKRDVISNPISTPGAFHAVHCHWRWGAVTGDPSAAGAALPAAGRSQFRGVGWTASAGGFLVDPALSQQSMRFAITKNDRADWAARANPSEPDFGDLFYKFGAPRSISSGGNLVLWLSFEVLRNPQQLGSTWTGWLFPNGIYFGHNRDATPALLQLSGAYGERSNSVLGRGGSADRKAWERVAH